MADPTPSERSVEEATDLVIAWHEVARQGWEAENQERGLANCATPDEVDLDELANRVAIALDTARAEGRPDCEKPHPMRSPLDDQGGCAVCHQPLAAEAHVESERTDVMHASLLAQRAELRALVGAVLAVANSGPSHWRIAEMCEAALAGRRVYPTGLAENVVEECGHWSGDAACRACIERSLTPPALRDRPTLFRRGSFTLHSGASSSWKIDCDGLTDADLDALAEMAAERLPAFGSVEGVPRGGVRFADKLRAHATTGPVLVVDDVLTTGASMEQQRAGRQAIGLVIFARSEPPAWVTALFSMSALRDRLARERAVLDAGRERIRLLDEWGCHVAPNNAEGCEEGCDCCTPTSERDCVDGWPIWRDLLAANERLDAALRALTDPKGAA